MAKHYIKPMPVFDLTGIEIINFVDDPAWNICLTLMLRDDVSEIATNGPNEFFLNGKGVRKRIPVPRMTEEEYIQGVVKMSRLVKSHTEIVPDSFIFEGRIEYTHRDETGFEKLVRGRCHIMLTLVSDTPQVTIAKKSTSLVTLDGIASNGSMSTHMMNFIRDAIKADLCIVFSGSTGSGKTTMLEASAKNIDNSQRIGVAEDAPELCLSQENVTYLHSAPYQPGRDPNSVATLEWVVAQFMRNRCDKLIVGETRGAEFGGFLTGANSGMDGSITTMHADDPEGCLRKMTTFATMARPTLPQRAINTDIATAVDVIIQLIKTGDGRYRTTHIQEISRTVGQSEEAKIASHPLFQWDRETETFMQTGLISDALAKKFTEKGIDPSPYRDGGRLNKPFKHHKYEDQELQREIESRQNKTVEELISRRTLPLPKGLQ